MSKKLNVYIIDGGLPVDLAEVIRGGSRIFRTLVKVFGCTI